MRKFYKRLLAGLLLTALLVTAIPVWAAVTVNNGTYGEVTTNGIAGWPVHGDTFSETAVLMNGKTGAVLYDKGMHDIRYPASTTKLMTLLVALEHVDSLDEEVTFTETGVREVTPDSTNIGMKVGEVMSLKSCFMAMIIQSANEVSTQIAEYVGGTEEKFIQMMNDKAKELGCKNTNFVNANGMPDENHYSTAYDLALIMRAGMKNKTFRKIVSTKSYTIPATNMSEKRKLHTHLPLLAKESPLFYEGCQGGKTGLTQVAQNTLVVSAKRDGESYIVVTMRNKELSHNCADSIALLDYGFNNFEEIEVDGGAVVVPKGTDVAALTVKEKSVGDKVKQTYYFSDHRVGTGYAVPVSEEVPEVVEETESADEMPLYKEDGNAADGSEDKSDSSTDVKASADGSFDEASDDKDADSFIGKLLSNFDSLNLSPTATILLAVMAVMILILLILVIALVRKKRRR